MTSMTSENQKSVFITGAARGIGKAIADQYAAQGYRVISPGRSELDLSSSESIDSYFSRNPELRFNVLINNAGINPIHSIADFSVEEWKSVIDVNLVAAFHLMQVFVRRFKSEGAPGRIVNVSSCYSIVSREGRSAYSASKAALNSLTRTAAIEFAGANILVNSVCPGFVATELTYQNNSPEKIAELTQQVPLKRLAEPSEVAHFVYYLGSENNTFITGQNLSIDGGFTIV